MNVVLDDDVAKRILELSADWCMYADKIVDVILRKALLDGQQGIDDSDLIGAAE